VDAGVCSSVFVKLTVPGPDALDHVPVPTTGMFPARVAENPQTLRLMPASAVVASPAYVTSTVSFDSQFAFAIFHSNLYVPAVVTPAVAPGECTFAFVKLAVPGP